MEDNNFDNGSGMSGKPPELPPKDETDKTDETEKAYKTDEAGVEPKHDSGRSYDQGRNQYNNSQYSDQNRGQYNNGQYGGQYNDQYSNQGRGAGYYRQKPKKKSSVIPILVIAIAIIFLFVSVFSFTLRLFSGSMLKRYGLSGSTETSDEISYSLPYIGVLELEGTIQGDDGSELSSQTYHHSWMLDKIEQLKDDSNNRGLIITVNTPGGGVYESDELYFAIKDYKESTGRPVYSYMKSQATSGGYYISAPCDKIFANRNCWTGSIGVTIGTLYDITGLLKKYGVKTVTIDSGANKSMGSYTNELTEEQQEILQSLVDEAYEQFVGIVAEGRKMKVKDVKKLADGRIYTAKQAKKNGLIDDVCSYDDAVDDMKTRFELESCAVHVIEYKHRDTLLYRLLRQTADLGKSGAGAELDGLKALMDQNGKFTVTYLSEIQK